MQVFRVFSSNTLRAEYPIPSSMPQRLRVRNTYRYITWHKHILTGYRTTHLRGWHDQYPIYPASMTCIYSYSYTHTHRAHTSYFEVFIQVRVDTSFVHAINRCGVVIGSYMTLTRQAQIRGTPPPHLLPSPNSMQAHTTYHAHAIQYACTHARIAHTVTHAFVLRC